MVRTAKLREAAEAFLADVSRFSVLVYKRIPYDQRWAIYYDLKEAADEIDNLRSRLEAIQELASVGRAA